jgi:hypothetical protein
MRTLQVFPIHALVFFRAYAGATMRALRPERCADCYRVKLLAAGHCGRLAEVCGGSRRLSCTNPLSDTPQTSFKLAEGQRARSLQFPPSERCHRDDNSCECRSAGLHAALKRRTLPLASAGPTKSARDHCPLGPPPRIYIHQVVTGASFVQFWYRAICASRSLRKCSAMLPTLPVQSPAHRCPGTLTIHRTSERSPHSRTVPLLIPPAS